MAAQAARDAEARAIVVFTVSGDTAACLSDERPRAPILALTREPGTLRRLALYWGVHAAPAPSAAAAAELMDHAERLVLERRWGIAGDTLVFVLGARIAPGAAHSVRIARLGEGRPNP